jgi:hypothetical protein
MLNGGITQTCRSRLAGDFGGECATAFAAMRRPDKPAPTGECDYLRSGRLVGRLASALASALALALALALAFDLAFDFLAPS